MTATIIPFKQSKIRTLISPSSLNRAIQCNGSVWLHGKIEKELPTQESSKYADKGTERHKMIADILEQYGVPRVESEAINIVKDLPDNIVKESIIATAIYLENLIKLYNPPHVNFLIEQSIEIYEDFRGTADLIGVLKSSSSDKYIIAVLDYKTGEGEFIEADHNYQLLAYAMGFIKSKSIPFDKIEAIELSIIQPAMNNFNKATYTPLQIEGAFKIIEESLDKIRTYNKNFKAGKHCQFCPVLSHCPEWRRKISESKLITLGDGKVRKLPNPAKLNAKNAVIIATLRTQITKWLEAVTEVVRDKLEKKDPEISELVEFDKGRRLKYWKDEFLTELANDENRYNRKIEGVYLYEPKIKGVQKMMEELSSKTPIEDLYEVRESARPIVLKKSIEPELEFTSIEDE